MRRTVQTALFRRALRAWKPDLGGSPSFRKRKGFPPDPLSEGNHFATSSTRRGRRMRRTAQTALFRRALRAWKPELGGSPSFRKKKGFPPDPLSEGNHFAASSARRGGECGVQLKPLRSGAPSARGNLTWEEALPFGKGRIFPQPPLPKETVLPHPPPGGGGGCGVQLKLLRSGAPSARGNLTWEEALPFGKGRVFPQPPFRRKPFCRILRPEGRRMRRCPASDKKTLGAAQRSGFLGGERERGPSFSRKKAPSRQNPRFPLVPSSYFAANVPLVSL